MKYLPTIDTDINANLTARLTVALAHNAAVVQLASELVAGGQISLKGLRRAREQFNKLNDNYRLGIDRLNDILDKILKDEGIEL